MTFEIGYRNTINQIIELLIWADGLLNIDQIEEFDQLEFNVFREFFKKKYTDDGEQKKKFIDSTFEFANKGIEVICKTIAGAYGTKTGSNNLKK